ncbi:hypothetical protein SAY87_026017 [Trapa incisa]|uniref:Uncharacterized protein n=1 Tax=Trapa incisa TaxID=236973 RepID=A0AAN7JKF0_9MYRT|nr:hypothetical protein SAY87_026017 [Trapa incisa]
MRAHTRSQTRDILIFLVELEVAPNINFSKSHELSADGIVTVPKRELELTTKADVGAPIGERREIELGAKEA